MQIVFFSLIFGIPLQIDSDTRGKISDLTELIFSEVLLLFWKTHSQIFTEKENNKLKNMYNKPHTYQWCQSGRFFPIL